MGQSQIRRGITQTLQDMKFVWTQVALFICGAVVIVHSAPASTAMDSKRADASSYVRFGKRNPESSDDFLSNLLEKRHKCHGGLRLRELGQALDRFTSEN